MEAVYRSYASLIHLVVRQGFGGFRGFYDPATRDDAVQTVFAAAFEERARLAYDGVHDYARFLRGLAHNVCRQMLDRDRRFARVPEPAPDAASAAPDLEADLIDAESRRICRAFADTLKDPLERAVLTRYFTDGAAEEALAPELGLTRYRLRKIIAAVKKKMTRHLAEHGLDG
ncbi:MAG: sigma-70 family RNA polymerase sigma factor [Deltaproteobacteria bacterium]|nr:sigma-70 family RNA polymerase sigma factor [Deltaproteobacteria bacterium]